VYITVWVILGLILAVIFLALFSKIRLKLHISKEGTITVKYLFIKYSHYFLNSDKKKSKNKNDKKNENSITKHFKDNGYIEGITQLANIIKSVILKILSLLKKGEVTRLRLIAEFSSGDAASTAITYGSVSAVLYPLVGWLNSLAQIKNQEVKINAVYDDKPFIDFEFELEIAVKLINLLLSVGSLIWELIIKNIKTKG